jgi:hypothetical protein
LIPRERCIIFRIQLHPFRPAPPSVPHSTLFVQRLSDQCLHGTKYGKWSFTSTICCEWAACRLPGGEVVACHRQDQTRQLKDTWPVGCSCVYMYQLATQLDSQQDSCFHPFYAYLFAARNSQKLSVPRPWEHHLPTVLLVVRSRQVCTYWL